MFIGRVKENNGGVIKKQMTETTQHRSSGYIRVLLADDCPLMLAGIRATLAAEPDLVVVGEVTDGAEVQ